MQTKYIVSFSTGASSAVAAKRALDRYGKENVEIVFSDTLIEDDDNYRFLDDMEKFLGVPIIRLSVGLSPFELSKKFRIIPNSLFAPCTFHLKIKPMQDYVKDLQTKGYEVVMLIGMNLSDAKPTATKPEGRLAAPRKNWGELNVAVDYPCLWDKADKDAVATVTSWGIKPPRMYEQGYTHANCGGRCVKQGQKDWRRTIELHPDRFQETKEWETEMMTYIGDGKRAIMKHTVKGVTSSYPLSEFEKDHNENYKTNPKVGDMLDDMGDVCGVECGVGGEEWNA